MRRVGLLTCVAALTTVSLVFAYVEAPYTLGRVVNESTIITLVEVSRVNKEKGLVIYKKLKDIRGKYPKEELKHNIGKRGFHPREWQNVMNWADVGKQAVFFSNGNQSETCIGTYWYQCSEEGEWWGMTHAEPFLMRSYCGDVDKLVVAVTDILAGKQVIVPCMQDSGNKSVFHDRKGKMQQMKASLKLLDYNQRRDFAGFVDGDNIVEYKTVVFLAESAAGWKFLPAADVKAVGDKWRAFDFDDSKWRSGKAPIGYGEEEIPKRKGTEVKEKGVPFVFRRAFDVPEEWLKKKGVIFRLNVASDDSADVYLNGALADHDPEADHEFAYWNREIDIPPSLLRPGRNIVAAYVRNHKGSSDIYLDMEICVQIPLPPKKK